MPVRFALAPATLLAAALALAAQPPDGAKKPADPPKAPAADDAKSPGIKLADGTYLWTGDTVPAAVAVSPQELQRLLDQVEQMKKQLAARKVAPPSSCAVRGKIEKRGDAVVAALRLALTFRTTAPKTVVGLGGRRGFLVSAKLDDGKLPVLETREDGFVAMVESPGDHSLALDLEVPVAGRGTKTEVGFELGVPRAAITTLALEMPPDVKQVSLTTRTPDPTKAPEVRRLPALDVKRLAGLPLGPVDQLELTWDPPATAAQPSDSVRAAEFDISTSLSDTLVETTAKVRFKGTARDWKLIAPASADVTVERVGTPGTEGGPLQSPAVTKPADANKPVWRIELPGSAADWVVTAVVRAQRAKSTDAKHRGPFAVGPFAATDVFRQSGTVRVSTAPNHRFAFRHGPELRQADPGAADEGGTVASFKFATGPTGPAPSFSPLLTFESHPLQGAVRVKPTYRLRWTEAGWRVTANLRVTPIRREVVAVAVEVPAEWGTPEATPAELLNGITQVKADGPRQTIEIKLAAAHKQPFDLTLDATVPAGRESTIPLLRFPGAEEQDATLTATVPDGFEVRGSVREWAGDQPTGWATPLAAVPGPDGKVPKPVASVGGKGERGLARAELNWQPFRPDLTAEVRADVTLLDRQIVVVQQFKLKAADGFPKPVRLRAPPGATGLRAQPPLDQSGGEWSFAPPPDSKEASAVVTFALPLPAGDAVRKVPVGLMWAVGATWTETVVRAWSNSAAGRTVTAEVGPWREIPTEAAADRDTLPAATLAGSGTDLPLAFEVRDGVDPAAVAVWVERAAVQVSAADDGASVRGRFLLKRWLASAVDVRLPPTPAGANPEFQLDGRRVDPVAVGDGAERVFRVPLPEARAGRTATLDVRYQLASNRAGGDSLFVPPVLIAAAFAGPVRWHVALPPGSVPLVAGDAKAEQRWRWRAVWYRPTGAMTAEELDRWFRAGGEVGEVDGGDAVSVRQASPAPLRVYRADRVGFVVVCSFAVFLVGWLTTRVRLGLAGVVVVVLGGAVAVGAGLSPHAAAQVAAAAEPGAAGLALLLGAQAAVRWHFRRRVAYLPGFVRRPFEADSANRATGSRTPPRGESTGSLGPAAQAAPSGT